MLDILVLFMLYHDLIQRNTLRRLLTELTLGTFFLLLTLFFNFLSMKLSPNKTRLYTYKTNWVAPRSHAAALRATPATPHFPHISGACDELGTHPGPDPPLPAVEPQVTPKGIKQLGRQDDGTNSLSNSKTSFMDVFRCTLRSGEGSHVQFLWLGNLTGTVGSQKTSTYTVS